VTTACSTASDLDAFGTITVKVQVCCACFSGTPPTQCWSCSSGELKEHRYRDCRKIRTCRLHGDTQLNAVRIPHAVPRCDAAARGIAVFLGSDGLADCFSYGPFRNKKHAARSAAKSRSPPQEALQKHYYVVS
jgi:hypothetical protein